MQLSVEDTLKAVEEKCEIEKCENEIMKLMVFTQCGIVFFKEEDWEKAKEIAKENNTWVRLV